MCGRRPKRANAYSFPRVLQTFSLIFAIFMIATIGKGDGDGQCVETHNRTMNPDGKEEIDCVPFENSTDLSFLRWGEDDRYKELRGQYFVFSCTVLFLIVSIILDIVNHPPECLEGRVSEDVDERIVQSRPSWWDPPGFGHTPPQSQWVKIALFLGTVLLFVAGSLETWYATGFGKLPRSVPTWAIASGVIFFASLMYLIDFLLGMKYDNPVPTEPNAMPLV